MIGQTCGNTDHIFEFHSAQSHWDFPKRKLTVVSDTSCQFLTLPGTSWQFLTLPDNSWHFLGVSETCKAFLKADWKCVNKNWIPPVLKLMMMRMCVFQWWLWWKSCANKLCTLNKGFSPSFRLNGTKKSAKKWQITSQVVLCAQYSLLCFMQKSDK